MAILAQVLHRRQPSVVLGSVGVGSGNRTEGEKGGRRACRSGCRGAGAGDARALQPVSRCKRLPGKKRSCRLAITRSVPEKSEEGEAIEQASENESTFNWFRVVLAFIFPALGGLLFGYDIGATSGAIVSLTSEATGGVPWFDLTPIQSGLVVSSSLAGALISSVAAFFIGDEVGRRREILLAAILYIFGTALEAGASSYIMLVVGRVIYGLGIGFAMHGAPACK